MFKLNLLGDHLASTDYKEMLIFKEPIKVCPVEAAVRRVSGTKISSPSLSVFSEVLQNTGEEASPSFPRGPWSTRGDSSDIIRI